MTPNPSNLEKVLENCRAFKLPVNQRPDLTNEKVNRKIVKHLREELDELQLAIANGDKVKVLDALTDLQYVLASGYIQLGFYLVQYEAFARVHEANMKKLDENGNPIFNEDGKYLKPPGWEPPILDDLIEALES